jgi:hypothetical protein
MPLLPHSGGAPPRLLSSRLSLLSFLFLVLVGVLLVPDLLRSSSSITSSITSSSSLPASLLAAPLARLSGGAAGSGGLASPPIPSRVSAGEERRGDPFGVIWRRWDEPHDAEHGTWVVQNARIVLSTRTLTVRGSVDQDVSLPVRGGPRVAVEERREPPACTETVPAAVWHAPNGDEFWDNYWHWNLDTFLLLLQPILSEVDAGHRLLFFSGLLPPDRLKRIGAPVPDVTVAKLYDQLSPWVKESLEMVFGGKDGVVFVGRSDEPSVVSDRRVLCVDRLYVGADRQCAHQGDADASGREKGECQGLYKLWRQLVWRRHGVPNLGAPLSPAARPVVVSLVTRNRGDVVTGKRMMNEEAVVAATRAMLAERYGAAEAGGGGGWRLDLQTCDDIGATTRWWAASSVVVLNRGACQANIPLTRDDAAVIYISLCAGGRPQLTPQPDYFTTVVHQQEHPPPDNAGGCNYQDYTVNVDSWRESLRTALDATHPV